MGEVYDGAGPGRGLDSARISGEAMSRSESKPCAARGRMAGPFRDVPDFEWNDWRWQLKHLVRTPERLGELLRFPPAEVEAIRALAGRFRFGGCL